MTNREIMRNQLRLADDASDSFKSVNSTAQFQIIGVWMSFVLLLIRAVCAALLEIADCIREAGARR